MRNTTCSLTQPVSHQMAHVLKLNNDEANSSACTKMVVKQTQNIFYIALVYVCRKKVCRNVDMFCMSLISKYVKKPLYRSTSHYISQPAII
jgi:hypothetical protein